MRIFKSSCWIFKKKKPVGLKTWLFFANINDVSNREIYFLFPVISKRNLKLAPPFQTAVKREVGLISWKHDIYFFYNQKMRKNNGCIDFVDGLKDNNVG